MHIVYIFRAGQFAGAVCRGQVQLALFVQGKVDGAGAVRRGRGQSPFSAPPDVVGSIFFCQQKFHSVAQTWCHVFVNYEHGTMLANVVYYH